MPDPCSATDSLAPYHTSGREFQILSLDGGGIRGLYTATLLADLERDLGIRVTDHFDLISGTSTGGIIALGLALGKTPAELVEFYKNEGPKIFPKPLGKWSKLNHFRRVKYDPGQLESCLRLAFGEKKVGDCSRAIVLPTYNLDTDLPVALKTPHHPNFTRDLHIPAWQAALATSAAPTYLPASAHIGNGRHIDGGMWANNPALIAAIEAHRFLGVPLDAIKVLSIGTGRVIKERERSLDRGGQIAWSSEAVDVLFSAQGAGTQDQLRLLLGDGRVHRINPSVPTTWKDLDVLRPEYAAQAAEDAKTFGPTFTEQFRSHQAVSLDQLRTMTRNTQEVEKHAQN